MNFRFPFKRKFKGIAILKESVFAKNTNKKLTLNESTLP